MMQVMMPSWMRTPTLLPLTLALSGCAQTYDLVMHLYASEVAAYAVVEDRLLSGRLRLYTDRTGTLTLNDAGAALDCMGALRYTSSTGGTIQLRCSNGVQTALTFQSLTETSGHGRSTSASLAYGLAPEQARAWLHPPTGQQIEVNGENLRLLPHSP